MAKALGGVKRYGLDTPIPISKVLDVCGLADALWVLAITIEPATTAKRVFACDCAERVLPLYETAFPDDDRPRHAIEVARSFTSGEATKEELGTAFLAAGMAAMDALNAPGEALNAPGEAWEAARAALAARDAVDARDALAARLASLDAKEARVARAAARVALAARLASLDARDALAARDAVDARDALAARLASLDARDALNAAGDTEKEWQIQRFRELFCSDEKEV